jgi:hypothetical protein
LVHKPRIDRAGVGEDGDEVEEEEEEEGEEGWPATCRKEYLDGYARLTEDVRKRVVTFHLHYRSHIGETRRSIKPHARARFLQRKGRCGCGMPCNFGEREITVGSMGILRKARVSWSGDEAQHDAACAWAWGERDHGEVQVQVYIEFDGLDGAS